MDTSHETNVEKAIRLAGGPSAMAREIGVTPWAISKWREQEKVPAERVLELSRLTGYQVTPHEIRPDIYPDADWLPTGTRTNGTARAGTRAGGGS